MIYLLALWGVLISLGARGDTIEDMKNTFARPEKIEVPYPLDNPYSEEKLLLGKTLFYDKRLSGDGKLACVSCHLPEKSWTDGRARARGFKGKELTRKAMTIMDTAWRSRLFWDGRAHSLEEQAVIPIEAPDEMNNSLPDLIIALKKIPGYRKLFEAAFPGESISGKTIAQAIATFERTIISPVTPFDKWLWGDKKALSASAVRGFVVFSQKGKCTNCHNGWQFTDGSLQDTGLPGIDRGAGRFLADYPEMQFSFRVPTLRNLNGRGGFMHDGSIKTLEAAIENYNQAGTVKRPSLSRLLRPLHLTSGDVQDLVAFLKSLHAPVAKVTPPVLP